MHAGPRPNGGWPSAQVAQIAERLGWGPVRTFDSVGSTNAVAAADAAPGLVVVAAHQSAGRGRLGRSWTAPPGAALALSCVLPAPADAERRGWVPLLVGTAVTRALQSVGGHYALKWPNDVLARAGDHEPWRKICGILCQTAGPDLLVVGVGVNLTLTEDELPSSGATSLRLIGADADPDTVVSRLLTELAEVRDQCAAADAGADSIVEPARREYRDRCVTLGSAVRLERSGEPVHGRAVDVDACGRIVIEAGGERTAYAAGDVVHLRPGGDQ